MKKEYPKTNLNRQQGFPFVMAFVYTPGQTKVYTGDLETIRNHLRNGPTCHGVVIYYNRGVRLKLPSMVLEIFGKGAYEFRRTNYLHFEHLSIGDAQRRLMMTEIAPYLDKRKKFVLVENFGAKQYVLGKWRKIPKTYLPILKEYDATGPLVRE
jgi:hypothetical protein